MFDLKIYEQIKQRLNLHSNFRTPDNQRGRDFRLIEIGLDRISIETQKGSKVRISSSAINKAHEFLSNNKNRWIRIDSSNNNPGEFASFVRSHNNGVRCVNYILPIFESLGIVEIDGSIPNKVKME